MSQCLFVRDIMSRSVVTCGLNTPLDDVARRMTKARATAIMVVDSLGELSGIISRSDLSKVFVAGHFDLRAEDIMTAEVVTVIPDIPAQAAVQIMLDRKIHQLVILHVPPAPARPVGILSMDDVVKCIAGRIGQDER